jgi:hypothetical protein
MNENLIHLFLTQIQMEFAAHKQQQQQQKQPKKFIFSSEKDWK